jgi:hypothetical protein
MRIIIRAGLVRYADAIAIDHFPALPAGEKQDQDDEEYAADRLRAVKHPGHVELDRPDGTNLKNDDALCRDCRCAWKPSRA